MLVQTLFNFTLIGAEWVLWLLVILFNVAIAVMVERAIVLFRRRVDVGRISQQLDDLLGKNDLSKARALLEESKSTETRICLSGLEELDRGLGAVEEAIMANTTTQKLDLEKHLAYLGTLGANAPFIGLFGTVLGIIKAFHDLSLGTKEGAAAVMSGISEALVATAVGLLVAIPAVVTFNIFQRRVKKIMANADTLCRVLYAHLKSVKAGGDSAAAR